MNFSNNKIWIISELFSPEKISTAHILTAIACRLNKEFDVEVITGPRSYSTGEHGVDEGEIDEGIIVHRCRSLPVGKDKIIFRILRLIVVTTTMAYKIIKLTKSNDRILLVTNPSTLLLLIGLICKIKKVSYTILVHDFYPENMHVVGIISPNGLIHKCLRSLFLFNYRNAEKLIVLGRDMQNKFAALGITNTVIIENWADEVDKNLVATDHMIEKMTALYEENKVFLFAGNFGRLQGIEHLLASIENTKNENVCFVFAGHGAMATLIEEYQVRLPGKVHYLGPFPREIQFQLYEFCDAGIVSLNRGMYGLGTPSKTYNIMAGSKPILYLGDSGSEIDLLIQQYGVGYSHTSGSVENTAIFFDNISRIEREHFMVTGGKASGLVKEKYTKEAIVEKYVMYFRNKL